MAVRVTNTQRKIKAPLGRLRRAAQQALSCLGLEGAELSLLITGDRKMRSLNREYRGLDRTTDVLSFSMLEGGGARKGQSVKAGPGRAGKDAPPIVLGDIVISAPKAMAQAGELGHGLEDELIFLLVHGILHLVGYDHERSKAGENRMLRKQRELVGLLTGK